MADGRLKHARAKSLSRQADASLNNFTVCGSREKIENAKSTNKNGAFNVNQPKRCTRPRNQENPHSFVKPRRHSSNSFSPKLRRNRQAQNRKLNTLNQLLHLTEYPTTHFCLSVCRSVSISMKPVKRFSIRVSWLFSATTIVASRKWKPSCHEESQRGGHTL